MQEDIPKKTLRAHECHYEILVMLFGLTNKTLTFKILINSILKTFPIKVLLVFFDDVLIYNKYWAEHVQHVEMVFKLLEDKHLYVKPSKCAFGFTKWNIWVILYLMKVSKWTLTKLKLRGNGQFPKK